MHQPPPLSTELALRAFEADAAFSTALAQLQPQLLGVSTAAALVAANEAGFCWLFRPIDGATIEAVLRHAGGSEEKAIGPEPLPLLLGLLGVLPVEQEAQAADPEPMQKLHKAAAKPAAAAVVEAAESLAAATSGTVVEAEPADEAEPSARAADDPLSDEEKAAAVAMVKAMDVEQRKAFAIAFRHAFKVPSSEKAVAPLIQQFRHLGFVDRFTGEAAGVVKP